MLGREDPRLDLLSLVGIWKHYDGGWLASRSLYPAVRDVSLGVTSGEIVGLAGESGSGKSTIARIATALLRPSRGAVLFEGADVAKFSAPALRRWRRQVQIVFQDPSRSLNPRKTVRQILSLPLRVQGLPVTSDRLSRALGDVGLTPASEYLGRFPHQLSGGQRQRVAIARALILDPRILVADEPVSALDVSVRAQILLLIKELAKRHDLGVLLISHDLAVLRYICSRILIMFRGAVVEEGPTSSVIADPQHPYTRQLLAAVPKLGERIGTLVGRSEDEQVLAGGCYFRSRCPIATERCATDPPELRSLGGGHAVRCLRSPLPSSAPARPAA